MSESRFERMMEAYNTVDAVASAITPMVKELKENVSKDLAEVNSDRMLSDEGRRIKREEIKKKYGKKFLEDAKSLREKYDENVMQAQALATVILNETPKKPYETEIQTFERKYKDLKARLMLQPNAGKAANLLKEFAREQNDPYFFYKIKDDFPSLISAINSDDVKVKETLKSVYDYVSDKSMTDEQKEAERIYTSLEGAYGSDLFIGIHKDAITSVLSRDYAMYANKPDQFKKV